MFKEERDMRSKIDDMISQIRKLEAWEDHFAKQSKRYGLTEELKENGIIYGVRKMEKRFTVTSTNNDIGRSYTVYGHEWNTLETVWLSQKCWFATGSVVTITDENGNSQVFVKE